MWPSTFHRKPHLYVIVRRSMCFSPPFWKRTHLTRQHAFKWAAVTMCLCYWGDWQIQVCHRWRGKQKDKTTWETEGKHFDNFKDCQMWRECVRVYAWTCVLNVLLAYLFLVLFMHVCVCVSYFLFLCMRPYWRVLAKLIANFNRMIKACGDYCACVCRRI